MCVAIAEMRRDSRLEGRLEGIKEGEARGEARGRAAAAKEYEDRLDAANKEIARLKALLA